MLFAFAAFSCHQNNIISDQAKVIDSLPSYGQDTANKIRYLEDKDSILANASKANDCPIKILSSRPVEEEYSNYKNVYLSWKNVSKKTISAVRFRWIGVNAFGEPADMGSLLIGEGAGFSDDKIRAGKSDNGTWTILSRDLKKITRAWAYEVAFSDGTKWKLNE